MREFDRLLAKLAGPTLPRAAELFIPAYALCARFEVLLELFTEEALKLAPEPPPGDDDEEEVELAHEESIRRGIRARLLTAMEERLRLAGRQHPECLSQVAAAIDLLEEARARLELNYQVLAGLEQFFLRLLRLFALRARA